MVMMLVDPIGLMPSSVRSEVKSVGWMISMASLHVIFNCPETLADEFP